MVQYQLDLIFQEETGKVVIFLKIVNPSLSNLDIQEAIENGSLREDALRHIAQNWGEGFAEDVRSGRIGMICTETSPDDADALMELLSEVPLQKSKVAKPGRENLEQRNRLKERQH